jgi:hypothetical protein
MKKLRFILLLLIIASCSKLDFQKNDLKALGLKGKVKSFLQKNYSHLYEKNDYKEFEYHFDKKGFVKKKIKFSNSTYTLFDYGDSNKIKKSELFSINNDKLILKADYDYNQTEEILKIEFTDSIGKIIRVRNYSYSFDEIGNKIITEKEVMNNGQLIEYFEKFVDENDREFYRINFSDNKVKKSFNNTKYDEKGKPIYRDKLDTLEKMKWSVKIDYDKNGFEIERIMYNPSIDRKNIFKTEYELDNKMNWIKKYVIQEKDTLKTLEREIEYY